MQPWLLDTQYRMHPGIASFPNDLFYAGNLKSGVTAKDRPAPQGEPTRELLLWLTKCLSLAVCTCSCGMHIMLFHTC